MNTAGKTLFLLSTVFLLASHTAAQEVTEAQREAITKAVIDITENGRLAAEHLRPADEVFSSLIDGAEAEKALFITQGDLLMSRAAIIESRQPHPEKIAQSITVTERHVYVLSPNSAVLSEHGHFTFTHRGKKPEGPIKYGLTLVYTKVGNAWKMVHGHQSFLE